MSFKNKNMRVRKMSKDRKKNKKEDMLESDSERRPLAGARMKCHTWDAGLTLWASRCPGDCWEGAHTGPGQVGSRYRGLNLAQGGPPTPRGKRGPPQDTIR